MAQRKRKPASRKRPRKRPAPPPAEPLLSPETARTVIGLLLLLVALILLLSLLGIAGPLGRSLAEFDQRLLGLAGLAIPFLIGWYGLRLFAEDGRGLTRNQLLGSLLSLLSLAGLLHVFAGSSPLAAAEDGRFGGLVGYGLRQTVSYAVGLIGSFLIFAALLTIGVLITLDRPLRRRATDPGPDRSSPPVAPPRPDRAPAPAPRPAEAAASPQPDFQPRVVDTAWEQPPLSLLSDISSEADPGDTKRSAEIIERTLLNFNIVGKVESINVGPAVTQYELRPDPGVKLNQITALNNDLALALAAHPIRIEAPIPGKSTVGIEAPNPRAATVRLHKLFNSKQWKRGGALPLALGLDVSGNLVVADLATMPHLLIAGQTGSGKSIGINAILASLLFTHSPKHLRLLLVDPKRVELGAYNGIPHLIAPVITDSPKVVNALKWVVSEMERRYALFQDKGVRDLGEYNKKFGKEETVPQLVVVIDELADLMAVAGKTVEGTIVRIAQLSRATGIHLVLATQRPSTNVITGVIKANLPSRVAFAVASATDSRVVLDTSGAEKLLGKGDMLFSAVDASKPMRVQGAFVDGAEIQKLTDFLKGKGTPTYDESVTERAGGGEGGDGSGGEGDDPLYDEAKSEVIRSRKASASLLQRRLKVGYARAARLLDMLEENGVIGPGEGAKPRDILVESDE